MASLRCNRRFILVFGIGFNGGFRYRIEPSPFRCLLHKPMKPELIALKERKNELKTRIHYLKELQRDHVLDARALEIELKVVSNRLMDVEIDLAAEEDN